MVSFILGNINNEKKISGKLNKERERYAYVGGTTNTAKVSIVDNIIKVDAKIDTEGIEEKLQEMRDKVDELEKKISEYDEKLAKISQEIH